MLCDWMLFPNSLRPNVVFLGIGDVFDSHMDEICSSAHKLKSNDVLASIAVDLTKLGFVVEEGKRADQLIHMPVLFGERGQVKKDFYADAFHSQSGTVIEVEAGRAVANNQFLKDLFEACMMDGVRHLCIAVRKTYEVNGGITKDYEKVCTFFQTLYASNRVKLPLEGIMVIGY